MQELIARKADGGSMKCWIDCDPGLDDALALFLLAGYQDEVEVMGLSATAGNVGLDQVFANLLALSRLLDLRVAVTKGQEPGRQIPINPDFQGINGLGSWQVPSTEERGPAMADCLYEAAVKHPGEISLVALGPLTNIWKALDLHPDLATLLKEIRIMGGSRGRGNRTPTSEFNFWFDPEAAHRVLSSGLAIKLYDLEWTRQVPLTRQDLQTLDPGPGLNLIFNALADFALERPMAESHLIPHDALVVASLVEDYSHYQPARIRLQRHGPAVGQSLMEFTEEGRLLVAGRNQKAVFLDIFQKALDRLKEKTRSRIIG